jgi:hypothetical protein
MTASDFARGAAVVLAALLLIGLIDQTLERTLVAALAQAPLTSEAAYLAVRNRPAVLAATVITHGFASLLTGYIVGKLAGQREVQHAIAASIVATILYAASFVASNAMLPPIWARAVILFITPPALIAGAYVRGQARMVREEQG